MQITEDQKIEKYGNLCCHCLRNTPLPYKYGSLVYQVDITY